MHLLAVTLNLGERSVALMLGAAVAVYVAGRAAADATAGGRPASGGRLAVGHWVPVAVVTVVAAMAGQFAVAVGLVFATAVGCLSLGLGTLAVVAPHAVAAPVAARRTWPLLVPAALLTLLAGFHRDVPWVAAVALAVEGACVLAVWRDRRADAPPADPPAPVPGWVPPWLRPVQLLLAVGLAIIGAYLAMAGLTGAASANEAATPGLLTATFLAPLVVLPILGTGADLAHRGAAAAGEAASALVGVALLDACLGLPLAVAAAVGRARLAAALSADPAIARAWRPWLGMVAPVVGTGASTRPVPTVAVGVSAAVPFPLAVWRVDVVVLTVLAVAVTPVALGRWPIGRRQGVALLAGYVAYLFLTLWAGRVNV